ncbi:hypothetical protein [Sphingobacterium griseoflavum]|uniref:Major facilitator superfamily (MFS) profile domain-containing protein n=1 Tax=Sphingobacterium griseoflavum TaxID=1474952 RepID=A0ABQ3I1Q1_9SPHI|nr:hypothetical protein [Sphingobacterium griseoflavum]GHE45234.1 hypothetical protein GCM10017764_30700 [Sphingobacterium griseoflavum]
MIKSKNITKATGVFILITTLLFLWEVAHNLEPILITRLKRFFDLSTAESTLVDSSVYIVYLVMALLAGRLMKRVGYRWGIIIGLPNK